MTLTISNILWDTDDEETDLPEALSVPFQQLGDDIPESELSEVVSDWLTDEYGYCHFGFTIAVKEG